MYVCVHGKKCTRKFYNFVKVVVVVVTELYYFFIFVF